MAQISVEATEAGYRVVVEDASSSSTHEVTVAPETLDRLGGGVTAEELIEASFRFLLDREPKEFILDQFDLATISRYFPEYEARIGGYL